VRFALGVAAGLVLGLAVSAAGQTFTGKMFRDLADDEQGKFARLLWVDGWVEGLLVGSSFPSLTIGLDVCMKGMSGAQEEAIVDKYLENHPETWHRPLGAVAIAAFREACNLK
jgi:hypothetical protein